MHVTCLVLLQGVNIMAFCKEYNAQTAKMAGQIIPVEITVYEVRGWHAVGDRGVPGHLQLLRNAGAFARSWGGMRALPASFPPGHWVAWSTERRAALCSQ